MHGQEVNILMVREALPAYVQRGVDVDRAIAGLGFTRLDIAAGKRRISWDDFVTYLDRVTDMLGGLWAFEAANADWLVANPVMQLLAGSLLSAEQMYLLGMERMARKMYSHTGCKVERLPDGRIRVEDSIPEAYRPCVAFFYGSLAGMRILPRLLGQPDAHVEADITGHRGVFLVTPPPSQSLPSRAANRVREAVARLRKHDGEDGMGLALDESAIRENAVAQGQALASLGTLPELFTAFDRFMQQRFCSNHVVLWVKNGPSARLELVGQRGDGASAPRCTRPLTVGGEEVGRVEVDVPATDFGRPVPLLDSILPWLALGVRHCQRRAESPSAAPVIPGGTAKSFAQRWQLTDRQTEVLELVLAGAANKEVANALGTSVKNVEYHLTQMLRRCGAESRARLMVMVMG